MKPKLMTIFLEDAKIDDCFAQIMQKANDYV